MDILKFWTHQAHVLCLNIYTAIHHKSFLWNLLRLGMLTIQIFVIIMSFGDHHERLLLA